MVFTFYRRASLLPGVRLNVGTLGTSVSFGHRGAWYTVGPHGRRTATLGWPGSLPLTPDVDRAELRTIRL